MEIKNCLILSQDRINSEYKDFIGKYYHFTSTTNENILKFFGILPIEFVYLDPGTSEYFGYGKIVKTPFKDPLKENCFYVELAEYKPFSRPVLTSNINVVIVEQTTKQIIDEICLDGGIMLNFKADAHLMRVLGEQLIASERVGILELVKNAYDAAASFCTVRIEKVPGLRVISVSNFKFDEYEGPVIVIQDNGKGMTKDEIENGWLRPASTLKTNIKERLKKEWEKAEANGTVEIYNKFIETLKRENGNRIPLGEKGVGRFATHRLGSHLIIKTKVRENNYEYLLKVDWDAFDEINEKPVDLDSIGISLCRQEPSINYGKKDSGTQIIIFGGREDFSLTKEEILEINKTLQRLNSPNPNPESQFPSFEVKFECPQIENLESNSVEIAFDPIFTVKGIVDSNGKFTYDFIFNPPAVVPMGKDERLNYEQDLKILGDENDKNYWLDEKTGVKRKPECGSFFIHIDIWYRNTPWIGRGPIARKFKTELEEYGGISVYRDGINIFPAEWGTASDWLELSKRYIKRASNISYYNMIGNVEINQSNNLNLIDKTNREGIIENKSYTDLKKLLLGIIILIQPDFQGKREYYNTLSADIEKNPRKLKRIPREAAKVFSHMSKNYDIENDPLNLLSTLGKKAERGTNLVNLERSLKNLEKSLEVIKRNQDLMTEQAGYGLSIAVLVHEIAKTTSNFYFSINDVLTSEQVNKPDLEILRDQTTSLQSEIRKLNPLRTIRNERPSKFFISETLFYCSSVFEQSFKDENIVFEYSIGDDYSVTTRKAAVNQVLVNLIDNSIYWLSKEEKHTRKVFIKVNSFNRTVIVADNGPGINDNMYNYLFEPGYSLKFPPSGLGLYICKYYMNEIKGDIYLTNEKERIPDYKGAQFTLDFSRVKE